jgi:hypothetical protein
MVGLESWLKTGHTMKEKMKKDYKTPTIETIQICLAAGICSEPGGDGLNGGSIVP